MYPAIGKLRHRQNFWNSIPDIRYFKRSSIYQQKAPSIIDWRGFLLGLFVVGISGQVTSPNCTVFRTNAKMAACGTTTYFSRSNFISTASFRAKIAWSPFWACNGINLICSILSDAQGTSSSSVLGGNGIPGPISSTFPD